MRKGGLEGRTSDLIPNHVLEYLDQEESQRGWREDPEKDTEEENEGAGKC